jgi:AraC-like DNA-binding protein
MLTHDYTDRQTMITPDYEYFHSIDRADREVEYHNHDFYEVYFFISGKVSYIVEGMTYRLKSGDILLIHNRELHKPVVEPGATYERVVIWVNPAYLARHSDESSDLSMAFESKSKKNYSMIRPDTETLAVFRNILSKFEKACNSSNYGSSILKNVYMLELLIFLNKTYLDMYDEDADMEIESDEKVVSIVRHINANLSGPLMLDDLSSRFFVSKYHLLRVFKKHTGYTIHQYIQKKRLIMARSLLRKKLPVIDVCGRCGFGDCSNFIRAFKKAYGVPPGRYNKSNEL